MFLPIGQNTLLLKRNIKLFYRKPDYVEEIARKGAYEEAGTLLHAVCARLVHRLARCDIIAYLPIRKLAELHLCDTKSAVKVVGAHNGKAGYYLVGASRKARKHRKRIVFVGRLAKHRRPKRRCPHRLRRYPCCSSVQKPPSPLRARLIPRGCKRILPASPRPRTTARRYRNSPRYQVSPSCAEKPTQGSIFLPYIKHPFKKALIFYFLYIIILNYQM